MSQVVAGTFVAATSGSLLLDSDDLLIPSNITTMRLTIDGLDASNTVKTQKRVQPGGLWVDQTTYNSNQTNTAVTVADGERWQLVTVSQQTNRDIRFKMSLES